MEKIQICGVVLTHIKFANIAENLNEETKDTKCLKYSSSNLFRGRILQHENKVYHRV